MESPGLDGFHRGLDGAVAGDDDDFDVRVQGPDFFQGFQTVHVGHDQVQENGIKRQALQQGEALFGAGGQFHPVPLPGEDLETGVPHGFVIIDHQNVRRGLGHGKRISFHESTSY